VVIIGSLAMTMIVIALRRKSEENEIVDKEEVSETRKAP
jgi:hypothetical protein